MKLTQYIKDRDTFMMTEVFAALYEAGIGSDVIDDALRSGYARGQASWDECLAEVIRDAIAAFDLPPARPGVT